jgi:hypothetical protein
MAFSVAHGAQSPKKTGKEEADAVMDVENRTEG